TSSISTAFGNPWTVDQVEIKSGSQLNWTHTTGTGNATINIKGNLIVAGQLSFANNASENYTIKLNGTSAQSASVSGTLTLPATLAAVSFENTAGVTLSSGTMTLGGAATISAGASLT